jgi:hypothetical protein
MYVAAAQTQHELPEKTTGWRIAGHVTGSEAAAQRLTTTAFDVASLLPCGNVEMKRTTLVV